MSHFYPFCKQINLHVKGRISPEDANRQQKTAREILKRLVKRPGVILADEVGMGKTFVALAVAVSVALENKGKRPVVVMVPSSLKEKWPIDFELFREKCLPPNLADRVKWAKAERAVEFLKLLDDPPKRRKSIIFVTHGAMSRTLVDKWAMLAMIYQAIRGKSGAAQMRHRLAGCMGQLLRMKWVEKNGQDIWMDLLTTHPSQWLQICHEWGIDPENDDNPETDDDPVPKALCNVLPRINTDGIFWGLWDIPRRRNLTFDRRLRRVRKIIVGEMRSLWHQCLLQMKLRLPLLILDEAHHLKNPETRLASLFRAQEAHDDAEEIVRGPLARVFQRMIFLTATPFQLGHAELCSVLERFTGVCWRTKRAPRCGQDVFSDQLQGLRIALDDAQESALTLDASWGRLRQEDLIVNETQYADVENWWQEVRRATNRTPMADQVLHCYERTKERMSIVEKLLKPWVIRHLRPKTLPEPHQSIQRRRRLPGESILTDKSEKHQHGLPVTGKALLPFLLAARATSYAPNSRPVFAEGLASSYEAFLQTRIANLQTKRADPGGVLDGDYDHDASTCEMTDASRWYLNKLEELVPRGDAKASASHPKIAATVQRTLQIWESGEKVVVFCHYIATGRTLRQRISEAINEQIRFQGAEKLGCDTSEVTHELERIGNRFFDKDSPIRRACDAESKGMIDEFPGLNKYRDELVDIFRRNARTPSFLVRFFPLRHGRLTKDDMSEAMDRPDRSGLTLRELLRHFLHFLVEHCGDEDQRRYIEALKDAKTGLYYGVDVAQAYSPDELQGEKAERLIPNVRLVNGTTLQQTRQRLMLTFNTPFYPEILVASSVMAEGVDLHLNCRYTIHHDLCWNPSTLEQRTGRIDRIGGKVEWCGQPIFVYLPYVGETQDEKMYRVVMDRERWFKVVMGETYKVDARTTDKLAERLPFPMSAAEELSFDLSVVQKTA